MSTRPNNYIRQHTLLWIVLGLVFCLGIVLGYREITSPDLGFHLSTARWICENRAVPSTDPFTYTVTDHPYIDLQWAFQLTFYALNKVGGTALMVTATSLLTLVFAGILCFRTWRSCGKIPHSTAILLLLFFLSNHWEARPHLFSWILGSCVLLIYEEYKRGSSRWLPLLPVVMMLWVNTHSLFVLGLVIIGTYCFCKLLPPSKIDRELFLWSLASHSRIKKVVVAD